MKELKVLFGDLRHYTIGVHSSFVPVGIGYIATYLEKIIPDIKFKFKFVVHPDEALNLIDEWKPDILGLSNYIWNSNLSYRVCEYAKQKNKNILSVLGGPEFPSGTGASFFSKTIKDDCFEYLREKDCIDYYCFSDGETSFASVVQEYINFNFNCISLRKNNVEVKGSMSLTQDKTKLLIGAPILRLGLNNKVDGRDCIPSPYLKGYLDKFLNGKFIPSFETARGCPFFCTFCDQGLDMTKIVSFSTKRMSEELDYVCERVIKVPGSRTISLHDSNWGMYKKDVDLSDHILKLIDKFNWPTFIQISTPKNKRQQILEIDEKLKNRVGINLAQQSMNLDTLKLIKRENFGNDEYVRFVKELEKRGKNVGCELIIPLPNETKKTYFESTKILLDCGVNIGTYTLMLLQGAELGRKDMMEKYEMKSKWRVIPRGFGTYRGEKTFEVERVCVENNTMPYEDYLECRKFSFLVSLYSNPVFSPIRKLLEKDLKISYYDFIELIYNSLTEKIKDKNVKEKDLPNGIIKSYLEFAKESQDELFETKKDLFEFYSIEENYNKLVSAELGDNLLRKYSAKTLAGSLEQVIDFSINILLKLIEKKQKADSENNIIINSTRLWLKNLYILNDIFDWDKAKSKETIISLDYDIPNWFNSHTKSIHNFKRKTNIKMEHNEKNEKLKNEIITLFGNKDKNFALGRYFHKMQTNVDDLMKSSIKVNLN
jgi:radical SAM superfamily enzyme YgiQ (UPF0313 family)